MALHIGLPWVAALQSIFGPPSMSVQGRAFGWAATIIFGVLVVFLSGLYLMAVYCKSQYESFGYEMAACLGFTGALGIYGYMYMINIPEWALTYNWWITAALVVGNAIRGWILFRRIW